MIAIYLNVLAIRININALIYLQILFQTGLKWKKKKPISSYLQDMPKI